MNHVPTPCPDTSAAPPLKAPDRRRWLMVAAASALAGCSSVQPTGHSASAARAATDAAPETAAPFGEVEVQDLDWVDAARDRRLPVRLYMPPSSQDAPAPLFVFSHGLGGSRSGYSYMARHLASCGVACLHVQHVGSDRQIWLGNPFGLVGRLQRAARDDEAMARALDVRAALDRLLATDEWAPRLDPRRIAMGGHSYGANTTLLVLGARVSRADPALELVDPRFCAGVLLSAPPLYGERDVAGVLGPIQVPTLHITTTDDEINVPGYHSPPADRLAVYAAVGGRPKSVAVFDGGPHSVFTDRQSPGGPELNAAIKRATQRLCASFLDDAWTHGPELRQLRAAGEAQAPLLSRFDIQT